MEARLPGTNINFRCPDEVIRVIDEYFKDAKDAWIQKGRIGSKPSKDEIYTRLLRKGIKHTPHIKIHGDWNENLNKTSVKKKVTDAGFTFIDMTAELPESDL